jgi:demethylmenaquinone methyltransferase/2-methoxy-6-polyprenyl-1,4-benzoquinol methylase
VDRFSKTIQTMFANVSGRYDFMNRLLSGCLDIYWRKDIVKHAISVFTSRLFRRDGSSVNIADIASGTGDVAIEIIKTIKRSEELRGVLTVNICCSDFSLPMLMQAKEKIAKILDSSSAGGINASFVICDAQRSCFKDSTFDMVFIAFGVRNFSNIRSYIPGELRRIMNKNASLAAILEFNNIFNYRVFKFFHIYYNYFIEFFARLFSTDAFAYKYLVDSIKNLPDDQIIKNMFIRGGFSSLKYKQIFPYIVSRYIAIINIS